LKTVSKLCALRVLRGDKSLDFQTVPLSIVRISAISNHEITQEYRTLVEMAAPLLRRLRNLVVPVIYQLSTFAIWLLERVTRVHPQI